MKLISSRKAAKLPKGTFVLYQLGQDDYFGQVEGMKNISEEPNLVIKMLIRNGRSVKAAQKWILGDEFKEMRPWYLNVPLSNLYRHVENARLYVLSNREFMSRFWDRLF